MLTCCFLGCLNLAPAGAPGTTEWDFPGDEAEGEAGQGGEAAARRHGGQDGRHQGLESAGPKGQRGAAETGAAAERTKGEQLSEMHALYGVLFGKPSVSS